MSKHRTPEERLDAGEISLENYVNFRSKYPLTTGERIANDRLLWGLIYLFFGCIFVACGAQIILSLLALWSLFSGEKMG